MTSLHWQTSLVDNQEQVQGTTRLPTMGQGTPNTGTQIPAMNPTVNLHRTDKELIMEFIMKEYTIGLDWYVPNFYNTRVADIIKERLPIETTESKILFNCPQLREFFPTTTFKLDLKTGRVYTYLNPQEDIGIPCQQEEFDLDLLEEKLQKDLDISGRGLHALQRIPLVRKVAAPADIMDLEENLCRNFS